MLMNYHNITTRGYGKNRQVHDVLPEQQQNAEFITATGAKTHQL